MIGETSILFVSIIFTASLNSLWKRCAPTKDISFPTSLFIGIDKFPVIPTCIIVACGRTVSMQVSIAVCAAEHSNATSK